MQQSFSVAVDDNLEPEGSFAFVFMNSLQIDALLESKDEETLEKLVNFFFSKLSC